MTNEKYRRIDKTPYEISNTGKIRAYEDTPKIKKGWGLKPYLNQNGTVMVSFQYMTKSVARLVAEYFLDCDDLHLYHVKHKDSNKLNNNVDNLYLVRKRMHKGIKKNEGKFGTTYTAFVTNRKITYLGTFLHEWQAKQAIREAKIKGVEKQ